MNLPERMCNPSKTSDGYLRVNLSGKLFLVHVLVLEAFVSKRPEGMQVCHNNGIPDDNRLENLRWDLPKNNVSDRIGHGTYQYGLKNPNAKYTDEAILDVYHSNISAKEKSEKYNMSIETVYLITCGAYPRLKRLLQVGSA
jgi:hypothetical protein